MDEKPVVSLGRLRAGELPETAFSQSYRDAKFLTFCPTGDDKATIPVTDTEFNQVVNPQSFCTGVSLHHPALIQNTGPLIDMSDIRPGTSKCCKRPSAANAKAGPNRREAAGRRTSRPSVS